MAFLFFTCESEQQSDRDRNELNHSTLCSVSRDAVVSRLDKGCERANPESRSKAGVESKIVFGFRARDISLRIVETAADKSVGFCARPREREQQIAERCNDAKVRRSRTADGSSSESELVVDPIESYPDGKFSYTDGQYHYSIVARALRVAQSADGNRATSSCAERVGLLPQQRKRKRQGDDESESRYSKKPLHDCARIVLADPNRRARNIALSDAETRQTRPTGLRGRSGI